MAQYFAVLLVLCLIADSLASTAKPQVKKKTNASKDLCEVSTVLCEFCINIAEKKFCWLPIEEQLSLHIRAGDQLMYVATNKMQSV